MFFTGVEQAAGDGDSLPYDDVIFGHRVLDMSSKLLRELTCEEIIGCFENILFLIGHRWLLMNQITLLNFKLYHSFCMYISTHFTNLFTSVWIYGF